MYSLPTRVFIWFLMVSLLTCRLSRMMMSLTIGLPVAGAALTGAGAAVGGGSTGRFSSTGGTKRTGGGGITPTPGGGGRELPGSWPNPVITNNAPARRANVTTRPVDGESPWRGVRPSRSWRNCEAKRSIARMALSLVRVTEIIPVEAGADSRRFWECQDGLGTGSESAISCNRWAGGSASSDGSVTSPCPGRRRPGRPSRSPRGRRGSSGGSASGARRVRRRAGCPSGCSVRGCPSRSRRRGT